MITGDDVREYPAGASSDKMATAWLEFAEEAREKYPPPPPPKKKNEWGITDSESEEEDEQVLDEEGEGDHPPNAGNFLPQLALF